VFRGIQIRKKEDLGVAGIGKKRFEAGEIGIKEY
jgi:hypothetical protein